MNTTLNKPIAKLEAPIASPKSYWWIWSLEFTVYTDCIVVVLIKSHHKKVMNEDATSVYVINSDEFRQWLEDSGKLIEAYGEPGDTTDAEMSFVDYMTDHVSKSDFKEFIMEKKNNTDGYDWGF